MSRPAMKTIRPCFGTRYARRLLTAGLLLIGHAAQADIPPGYRVLETITYEYDAEGNRIARGATVSGVAETPIEAQYDQGNRLTQLILKGQGQNGADTSCALSYDLNGNLADKSCTDSGSTSQITTQYTWDSRNRLTGIQSSDITASFQYDPQGRRIERIINGHTTHYLYDGKQAIAELNGNTLSASYLTGLAIDEVIARYTTEGERTLLTDALGSVLIVAKEDTSISTAYGYSAYGETQVMGTDVQNPIQYTSRENDGLGLYYYRARYYDPQLKRFISEDPIGLQGGINIYSYVSGNPIKFSDPTGNVNWSGSVIAAGAAGIVGGQILIFELTSECACGKKVTITGYASFIVGGAGVSLAKNVSGSGGGIDFYDYRPCPTTDVANGGAAFYQASVVTVGGASAGQTTLGHLYQKGPSISTGVAGLDMSAMIGMGASVVTGVKIEDCDECKK